MPSVHRAPRWSGFLTTPFAQRAPRRWWSSILATIKAVHTAAFFSIAGLIVMVAWDGVRQRPRRRTAVAAAVAMTESAIFASNNQVCPLTPLAEELGAASGSVTDIFLPLWLSKRIPLLSASVLLVGLVFNVRAWLIYRSDTPPS